MFNAKVSFTLMTPLLITLQCPPVSSRLKLTDRSLTHHAPALLSSPPKKLGQPSARCSHISVTFLLLSLLYLRLSFTPNSRLISATNLFLLTVCLHLYCLFSGFSDLASVISSYVHFHCYHSCSHCFLM